MHESTITVANLNDLENQTISKHKTAEAVVKVIGSWNFIVIQTIILICWSILNIIAAFEHWDPYPFILLNLILSLQAAYAAPIIMMSQNRQAERDRLEAHNDYLINVKTENEVSIILQRLAEQHKMIAELQHLVQTSLHSK